MTLRCYVTKTYDTIWSQTLPHERKKMSVSRLFSLNCLFLSVCATNSSLCGWGVKKKKFLREKLLPIRPSLSLKSTIMIISILMTPKINPTHVFFYTLNDQQLMNIVMTSTNWSTCCEITDNRMSFHYLFKAVSYIPCIFPINTLFKRKGNPKQAF